MSKTRNLVDDQRGAMLVMCVFMAAFLVGCLWFVVGIGDAAVQRERLQDGADSAVFAAAVYHARGMNVIAMINIIMAAVLSVLAALKVSQMLNLTYLGIVTGNCACVWLGCPNDCPYVSPSSALADDLDTRIDAMEQFVDATLTKLSKTQVSIAKMVPYQAQARGTKVAKDDVWFVDDATAISISMRPSGKRLGLPVEEDSYKKLCEKAALVIGEVAMNPLAAYGLQPAPSGAYGVVQGQVPGAVQSITSSLCEDTTTNGKTPKKVFEEAKNGDKFFQVYSYVLHLKDHHKRADGAVDLPAWGDTAADAKASQAKSKAEGESAHPFALQKAGMAEAEFYYDTSGSWESYKDDTMWNMRWRARLRRYKKPPPEVSAMSPQGIAQAIDPYVKDVIH